MAYFEALLQYTEPYVADIGGIVAPEILSVTPYPSSPKGGEKVKIRAKVMIYSSMVPYTVKEVTLHYWSGAVQKIVPMKPLRGVAGVYEAVIPAMPSGSEVFYAVSAEDSWGNAAIELLPERGNRVLMNDSLDKALPGSLDILEIEGSYSSKGLTLCLRTREKVKRTVAKEVAMVGIALLTKDVRYTPSMTGGEELSSGWVGAYVPYLRVKDLIPTAELFNLLSPSKKGPQRAKFEKQGNKLCFTFSPEVVRQDYALGLKIAGLTVSAGLTPLAIKPRDATKIVIVYPLLHSYRVR